MSDRLVWRDACFHADLVWKAVKKLEELHDRFGQSPWLDARPEGVGETVLAGWLGCGVRGVTSPPAIGVGGGRSVESIYGQALMEQLAGSSRLLRPVYEESAASDGFVSVGISPRFARDSEAIVGVASELYRRVLQPNLMVEIPATSEGISAARRLVGEGRSVNVTMIMTLARYGQVIDAYLAGLESLGGNLSRCHCVASFCVSRVDAEVDRRLEAIGTTAALRLVGKVALAQAKVAYRMFEERFFGARWQALVTRGAKVQRPLWSWTAVENPAYPKLWYVENLVGPNTVTALSGSTIAALENHGILTRTIDQAVDEAEATLNRLAELGVDLNEVGRAVEHDAVSAWSSSYPRGLAGDGEPGELDA